MYHEVHGDGPPLVVLHGALTTIESSFGAVLPKLASTHRVIAIEQQAHGHTADIARPASYGQMAADTVELLRQLDIRQADVLGYSMGASVAFELAVRYPGIVRRLAIVAGCSNKSGYQPGLKNFMRSIDPTHEAWLNHPLGPTRKNVLERDFFRAARRREQWVAALTRTKEAFDSFRDLASDDLRSITAQTLLVGGNDGVIRPEHLNEISGIVPHARLELFPETNHGAMVPRAIEVVPAFFLEDASTARMRQCATVRT
jgi:pimeloyl-ACP methyl ester carboxylesterase